MSLIPGQGTNIPHVVWWGPRNFKKESAVWTSHQATSVKAVLSPSLAARDAAALSSGSVPVGLPLLLLPWQTTGAAWAELPERPGCHWGTRGYLLPFFHKQERLAGPETCGGSLRSKHRAAVLSDGFSMCRVLLVTATSKLILGCIFLSFCQLNKTSQHSKREQTEFIQTLPLYQINSSLRIKHSGQSVLSFSCCCLLHGEVPLMIPLVWPTSGLRAVQLTGEWEKVGQESEAQSSFLA